MNVKGSDNKRWRYRSDSRPPMYFLSNGVGYLLVLQQAFEPHGRHLFRAQRRGRRIIDVFCTAKAEEESHHLSTKLAEGFVWCFGTQAAVEEVGNCRHELHGRERFMKH